MKNYFLEVVSVLKQSIEHSERFNAWFSAESMDYARFNQAKIRQAGNVEQQYLNIALINGQKQATSSIALSSQISLDKNRIKAALVNLRHQISYSQDDPYLMFNEDSSSSSSVFANKLAAKDEVVANILKTSSGLDLVGSYLAGPIYKGFASSTGQTRWFEKSSFVLDTSVYYSGDKAIKQSYADERFDDDIFAKKIHETSLGIKLFEKESLNIAKGEYRVYFSPVAVYEILSMMNWGGFSKKCLEVKDSPLLPLSNGDKQLSSNFYLYENIAHGVGPNFQSQGYLKPKNLPIIENGQLKNTLISPKTAKEYSLDHNGADEGEQMTSIEMGPGTLLEKNILSELGDGLYINNLWYLNFSDKQNGCLTGMTRFFCYVVKNGQAVAPFSVMRFDDSIYKIFGENLKAITAERSLIIDNATYDERSTSSAYLPGIIADKVRFTL